MALLLIRLNVRVRLVVRLVLCMRHNGTFLFCRVAVCLVSLVPCLLALVLIRWTRTICIWLGNLWVTLLQAIGLCRLSLLTSMNEALGQDLKRCWTVICPRLVLSWCRHCLAGF